MQKNKKKVHIWQVKYLLVLEAFLAKHFIEI